MTDAARILDQAASEGREVLMEHEVYEILRAGGIAVPAFHLVRSPGEVDADLCARTPSDEVVVKIASPQITHKSDVGGVRACANRPEEVRRAVETVLGSCRDSRPDADLRGVLVAERVSFRPGLGREILAGFRHDPFLGPVVVAGVGGLDTEFLLEVLKPERAKGIGYAPWLDAARAAEILRDTVVWARLRGEVRSERAAAVEEDALAELVAALARLAERWASFEPEGGLGLADLEVNPFVATPGGRLMALDGLARVHRPDPLPAPRQVENLRHLLTPRSAVIIGASASGVNVGRIILRNLVRGGGIVRERIWAIHPKAAEIDGCRAFPDLDSLPEPADMAVVSIPADRGADHVVRDLVEKRRAKTVTLITGGFGETEGGRERERALRDVVDRAHREPDGGVLVNGGNCLGIISVPGGYNTFFLPDYKLPFHDAPGNNVASISQSGAYLVSQISNLDRAIRPRYAISFGNQMDVTVSDYLEYLQHDPEIRVFAVYLEGFRRGDGARFLEIARRITQGGRRVLLYKAGRTRAGMRAAASHTAAAVGDYEIIGTLVRKAGVAECATLNMFEDYLMTFSFLAGRPVNGRKVAVLSNAGFECTAAADRLFEMELAEFTEETRKRLASLLPPGIVDVHCPLDTTPITPTEKYAGCVEAMLDDPGVDAVVVAGVPATPYIENLAPGEGYDEDITRPSSLPSRLIRIFRAARKPMVFSVDSGPLYEACVQMMKRAGLPCFRKVDRAMRALNAFLASEL